MTATPSHHGHSWRQREADLIYLIQKGPQNDKRIAGLLERTAGAINFARRWNDPAAGFPREAENAIHRLLLDAQKRFGAENSERYTVDEALDIIESATFPAGSVGEPGVVSIATKEELDQTAKSLGEDGWFDPENAEDARQRTLASIVQRQGQPRFRQDLLESYGARCAISACDLPHALEAAHIVSFRGPETNDVRNGLLLRADLHCLFDRGLIAVDTETWTVITSPQLQETSYEDLDGQPLHLPDDLRCRPSVRALDSHRSAAGL